MTDTDRKEVELKPCPICGHKMLHKRTTKTTVSMPVSIRCGLCDLTVEMQNWGSLVKFWNGLQRHQDNTLVPLDKDQMYMAVIDELKKHHFTDFDAFQMDCTLNTICAKFGKDNSGMVKNMELYDEIRDCIWHYIDDAKDVERIMKLVRQLYSQQPPEERKVSLEEIEKVIFEVSSEHLRKYNRIRTQVLAQAILSLLNATEERLEA